MDLREAAIAALERGFDRTVAELIEFARIPGVSAQGFDRREVVRSAEHAEKLLGAAGLEHVEILGTGEAHPYVVGDWLHAGPEVPTVLIYAHHDVQPEGRLERWHTPPFEPAFGADGRLYGRGVVDDKAGLLLHLAALRAWLEVGEILPLNVKVLVEGEEEIGSPHLESFLRSHLERLSAEVIVLSDTANLMTGLPSLTTSLRGLVSIDLTVRALAHPVHSGMWGGPVLDAATALARLLSRLVDDEGCIAVPGLESLVPAIDEQERARLRRLPFEERSFRADAGMLEGSRISGPSEISVYERLWRRPSIAVTALEAAPLATAASQLIDEARARVGIRVAPGQDPRKTRDAVLACLTADPPWGVEVAAQVSALVPGWQTEPLGPAFDAARRSLEAGFGRAPVAIGCGGTIPFVGPFSEVMGGAPALLLGLEDPSCKAHGENESLDLDDFLKAARSAVHLLAELSGIPVDRRA